MPATKKPKASKKPKRKRISTGDPTLDNYLDTIADSQPLSSALEAELAQRIRAGDLEARNELVEANLRFVVTVAKEHQNRGLSLAELISAGNMGLLTAAKRFDETKGYKFISYAVWWIRQAIQQTIMEQTTVHIPVNRLNLQAKINRTREELKQNSSTYTNEDIARILGCSTEKVDQLTAVGDNVCCSLDAPITDGEYGSMLEQLADKAYPTPEEQIFEHSLSQDLAQVLQTLNEREAEVLKLYYGLGTDRPQTLAQIGEHFELTRERVRQIKEQALNKLRRANVHKKLMDYLEEARAF